MLLFPNMQTKEMCLNESDTLDDNRQNQLCDQYGKEVDNTAI